MQPERLTGEIAAFLDEVWAHARQALAPSARRTAKRRSNAAKRAAR